MRSAVSRDDDLTQQNLTPSRTDLRQAVYMWGVVEDAQVLVDLVSFLHTSARTAVLTIVEGPIRKSIYFRDGAIIAASSNQPEDRFGDIMVRLGLITRAELETALRDLGPDRKIGNVLLTRGMLSSKDLWRVIKVQIEEVVFSVLLMESGKFTVAHFDQAQVPTRTALNTQQVLLEGLRRKDEMEHLRASLPPANRRLLKTRPSGITVTLEENERRLYIHVDGRRTVTEVVRLSGLGAFEATRALHHLLQVGVLAVGEAGLDTAVDRGLAVQAVVGAYNDAIARIHADLAAGGVTGLFRMGVDSFLNDLSPEVAVLFDGVVPGPDGRLAPERISQNLLLSKTDDKLRLLQRGLNEYIQFLLFLARETLDFDRVEKLAEEIRERLGVFEN
jgi:hypothetical protein